MILRIHTHNGSIRCKSRVGNFAVLPPPTNFHPRGATCSLPLRADVIDDTLFCVRKKDHLFHKPTATGVLYSDNLYILPTGRYVCIS